MCVFFNCNAVTLRVFKPTQILLCLSKTLVFRPLILGTFVEPYDIASVLPLTENGIRIALVDPYLFAQADKVASGEYLGQGVQHVLHSATLHIACSTFCQLYVLTEEPHLAMITSSGSSALATMYPPCLRMEGSISEVTQCLNLRALSNLLESIKE